LQSCSTESATSGRANRKAFDKTFNLEGARADGEFKPLTGVFDPPTDTPSFPAACQRLLIALLLASMRISSGEEAAEYSIRHVMPNHFVPDPRIA
jgi:hypothetical protein